MKSQYNDGNIVLQEITDTMGGTASKVVVKRKEENGANHYEKDYYGPKGECLGKGIYTPEGKKQDGVFVTYYYAPMTLYKLEKYSNETADITYHYFTNGQ